MRSSIHMQLYSIIDKLAETGGSVQEELYVITLLASLPKTYENLVVDLEMSSMFMVFLGHLFNTNLGACLHYRRSCSIDMLHSM